MDGSLSGSGDRNRRTRRFGSSSSNNDMDKSGGDLDKSEQFDNLVKRERPPRTLSGELESSLVLGDNWKNLDTVHKAKYDAFGDSDSLMDDSFAGSSFATNDSFTVDEGADARAQFTTLDDEPGPSKSTLNSGSNSGTIPGGSSSTNSPGPSKRNTPRRTYSKQRKTMPKKSAPMSAISEDENADGSDKDDDF